MRPLAELDLGDELRLDPRRRRPCARAASSAARGTASRARSSGFSSFSSRVDLVVAEAGADVADVAELAALVDARARATPKLPRAAALAARVARDDELLAAVRLHLQPVARAPALAGSASRPAWPSRPRAPAPPPPRAARRRRRTPPRCAPSALRAVEQLARRACRSSAAARPAARRRPRARRTRSRRARPVPCCIAEKLGRPCSSSAQTSPSSTAFGVLTAWASAPRPRRSASVRSLSLRERERALAAADVRERAVAVPLHLVEPLVAARQLVGERGEHRLVASVRPTPRRRPSRCGSGASSAPCRRGGRARASRRPRAARRAAGRSGWPFALLLERARRCRDPRSRPCRRRTGPSGSRPRRSRSRAGDPRRGPRAPLARLERHALRHRPRGERAVALEPEVVVEPPRVVALDDEDRPRPAPARRRTAPASSWVALAPVGLELRHLFHRSGKGFNAALRAEKTLPSSST